MLIELSICNFRSIKTKEIFSMVSGNGNDKQNTFIQRGIEIVPAAVIYGANASGKSNILKAFTEIYRLVTNKYKIIQSTDTIPYTPFKLDTTSSAKPTEFEIVFLHENIIYRYGFSYDHEKIHSEWLFLDEKGREAKLFYRYQNEPLYINEQKFKEAKKVSILPNSLLLWRCDQNNGEISKKIITWFTTVFSVIDARDTSTYIPFSAYKAQHEYRKNIQELMTAADLGITAIQITDKTAEQTHIVKTEINTAHVILDTAGKETDEILFNFEEESAGTQKLFALSGPILQALQTGGVLCIDELDSSMHPLLCRKITELFTNPFSNTSQAQLIFTTHDTTLLDADIFHKSQIWFTEKDDFSSTRLFSLTEYTGLRKTENLEHKYLTGKFGAIPQLGEIVKTEKAI